MTSRAISPLRYARAAVFAVTVAAMLLGAVPAAAQSQTSAPASPDLINLVSLTTVPAGSDGSPTTMRFDATLDYRLASTANASILLFLFENNAESSTEQSSNGIPIKQGTGRIKATIDYTPHDGVRALSLLAGIFKGDQKMLSWVSTNPIPLAPWPGRAAFEKAMSARLSNNLAEADQNLTTAIQDSPDTGNYYYWRGDTRIRLQRWSDAIADFNRSVELMPKDRASRVGRGIAELWNNDPTSAISDLTVVINANGAPDRITAWAHRARGVAHANLKDAAAANGDFDTSAQESATAISDYQAYLALAPDAPDRSDVQAWISDLS